MRDVGSVGARGDEVKGTERERERARQREREEESG